MKIDFFIVPLFILPITSLIYKYKALANLLILFGKHSTNFWFIHGYFYDNYYIKLSNNICSVGKKPKDFTKLFIYINIKQLLDSQIYMKEKNRRKQKIKEINILDMFGKEKHY